MTQSRQLVAIMFTDIVGYTVLMGHDEDRAFQILKKNRELQRAVIERNHGRWIKELGDGQMATFKTAYEGVMAAIQIQQACKAENDFQLRIGIHLGEVVFENGDVFGDGVNIASRIQAVADPASIFISESVYQNIANKKEITTRFIRKESLKNVKMPVAIYEVVTDVASVSPNSQIMAAPPGETQKSIAVLPFVNMSNDPEQEYFCDGITEEIINALAQLDNLRVIARTSVFSFKGRSVDVRDIGNTLQVKTLLEGSVRKVGNRVRIITQLINVADGSHLWSNRYDRVLEDIFTIQEDIATNVAMALKGFLTSIEKQVIRRPETIIEAYECFLKGRQLFHQLQLNDARDWFQKAIELDPDYAPGYAGLADVHSWIYEWEGGKTSDLKAAEIYSLKAISLAPDMAESHTSRGFVLSLANNYEEAEQEFREAIRINPNGFDAHYLYGRACFARGDIEKSAELFRKASEVRREDFQSVLLLEQYLRVLANDNVPHVLQEGIDRARKQLALNPADRRVLSLAAGSLYDLGEQDEAFEWINRALKLYPDDAGVLINAACIFAKDHQAEKALEILEVAIRKGYGNRKWIEHDPDFDPVRDDPRFKTLLERFP